MSETPTSTQFADDGQRYRLDSRIATGGMGEVWRATDTLLGREVAVKLLKTEFADDPVFRSRFETEARHAASLHHPGIAAVFDVGESRATDGSGQPRPFLVMELVEGQPLSALLSGAAASGRQLDPQVVRALLSQVGEALGAAHRAGIIHRDVKPANLIVTPQQQVKVTDFGIARAADGVGITRTGAVMGTPQYLSPEQAEGKPATSASDVYALGVVAFECLAGRRPFDAESPVATALAHIREPVPELPASVPRDLAAVVRRALSKNPAERYPDGAAFAAALRDPATAAVGTPRPVVPVPVPTPRDDTSTQVLAATPYEPPTGPVTTSTTTTQASRSSVGPIVVVVLLLVALAVVLTLLLTGTDDDDTPAADETSRTRTPSTSATSTEPSTEPTSETSSADTTVNVDYGAYKDRPVEEVESELRNMDLRVELVEQDNTDPARNGLVNNLYPSGPVEPNTIITLEYAGDAPVETETVTPPPETPTDPVPPTDTVPPTDVPTS